MIPGMENPYCRDVDKKEKKKKDANELIYEADSQIYKEHTCCQGGEGMEEGWIGSLG